MVRVGTRVKVMLESNDVVLTNLPHSSTDLFWQSVFKEMSGPTFPTVSASPGPAKSNPQGHGAVGAPVQGNVLFRNDTIQLFDSQVVILKPFVQWVSTTIQSAPKEQKDSAEKATFKKFAEFVETDKTKGIVIGPTVPYFGPTFIWKPDFDYKRNLSLHRFRFYKDIQKQLDPYQGIAFRFSMRRSPAKSVEHKNRAPTNSAAKKDVNVTSDPFAEIHLSAWKYKIILHAGNQYKADVIEITPNGNVYRGSLYASAQAQNVVGNKLWVTLMVYPFFNQIYFIFGTAINEENTINHGNALILTPPSSGSDPVTSKPTPINISLWGGNQVEFGCGSMLHSSVGFVVSAPIVTSYTKDTPLRTATLKVYYMGKNSSRIQGVDKGDSGTSLLGRPVRIWGKPKPKDLNPDDTAPVYQPIQDKTEIWKLLVRKGEEDEAFEKLKREAELDESDPEIKELIKQAQTALKEWHKGETQQFKWILLLKALNPIYTPGAVAAEFFSMPDLITVSNLFKTQVDPKDILAVQVRQNVQGSTATVELLNRHRGSKSLEGRYTKEVGIKPITIEFGDSSDDFLVQHFRGYIVQRTGSKGQHGAFGTMRWDCEDRSYRLKQVRTFNLPIFDGWCNLATMFYLAKVGGLKDDELVIFQDPNDPTNVVTINQVMEEIGNDNKSLSGPCWEGHIKGWPPNQTINGVELPGAYLHATLPSGFGVSQPYYMTQMGREVWSIMSDIAITEMQFYLYANNYGNIVYQPPEVAFGLKMGTDSPGSKQKPGFKGQTVLQTDTKPKEQGGGGKSSMRFVEVAERVGNYNELRRTYQGTYNSRDTRNAVLAMGLVPLHLDASRREPVFAPLVAIEKEKDWPSNTDSFSWQPWLNIVFMQNAEWANPNRLKFIANQTAQRLFNRPFLISRWSAWGQKRLHPYMLVTVDESKTQEIQQSGSVQYIVTDVVHTFSMNNLVYECEIEGELFIPTYRWVPPTEDYGEYIATG